MARSYVASNTVTRWEVGYEDRAESPTLYSHRSGTAHIIATISFDLLRDSSEKPVHYALNSKDALVALRAAAWLRLTHVVRALGIARLVSVNIIDCSGGYAARRDSDPHLHTIVTDFPFEVYVQDGGDWGDSRRAGRGWNHPSYDCLLHKQHDWIRSSVWSSNRLQLVAIDRPSEREAIRFSLASLIEQVYGTQVHSWTPNLPLRQTFAGFDTQPGYALCSDLLGFVLPKEDRTNASKRVWSHPNEVLTQLQVLAKEHGCDVGDVRDIALWLDSNRADRDPPRAAEHGPYDLCVDVAEAFGLEYDRADLAQLRRLADGPDTF